MPTTKIEIGSVASALFGASMLPTIAPVAKTIVELAPASACAMARRATLLEASRRWAAGRRVVAASACDMVHVYAAVQIGSIKAARSSQLIQIRAGAPRVGAG